MRKIAQDRGGKCLSERYKNMRLKLEWECSEGHTWLATPGSIKSNHTWCPVCNLDKRKSGKQSNVRLTIDEMQLLAKKHSGKCLSKKYVNIETKLEWECSEGHTWLATPKMIKYQNCWCPVCAHDKQRASINDIIEIAKARGGECLSEKYHNVQSKMKFRCSEGHIWKSEPGSIKKGHWCPVCGIKKSRQYLKSVINNKIDIYVYASNHNNAGEICEDKTLFETYDVIRYTGTKNELQDKSKILVDSGLSANDLYFVQSGINILKKLELW